MSHKIIYEWPYSQLCMDCKNKDSEIYPDSSVSCSIKWLDSDGVFCEKFEPIDDEDDLI